MIRFVATIAGAVELDRAFNRVEQYIDDFRNFWPAITKRFYDIERAQFNTEGARGASGKWKALSPGYARFKARKFPGQTILKASTALFESMTSPDAFDSIFIPDRTQLTLGTKALYALAHQQGAGRLPARPIISLTETDKRDMQKDIQRQLVQFTRATGFRVEERAA